MINSYFLQKEKKKKKEEKKEKEKRKNSTSDAAAGNTSSTSSAIRLPQLHLHGFWSVFSFWLALVTGAIPLMTH